MRKILAGSRFTQDTLLLAHKAPIESLPALNEEQKRAAISSRMPEEAYARSLYACLLAEREWGEIIARLGAVLESFLAKRLPRRCF